MRIATITFVTLMAWSAAVHAQGHATLSMALNSSALQPGQNAVIAVVIDVRLGFHAQSHQPLDKNLIPLEVSIEPDPRVRLSEPRYPPGKIEQYKGLGRVSVYTGRAIVYVPIQVDEKATPGTIKLKGKVTYQICDDRTCFAPEEPPIEIESTIVGVDAKIEPANSALFAGYDPNAQPVSDGQDLWFILAKFGAAFLAGLLFNIMPCVLPVLPLKIVGFYEAAQHNRLRAFLLGVVFSIGVIAVFAVLSIFVVVFKSFGWGDLFTYGWFVWGMVILLTVLAAGLMGGWNLSLPLGIYTFEPRHDTYAGNFFWGGLSAILATPCTAPLLPGVLLWATQQAAAIGVAVVIMVGVGMAFPYLLLSAMPEVARRFPRTGPWSELFKQMMGFLMLAAAAYFGAGRLIAGPGFFWVVTAVVAVAAIYLVVRTIQLSPRARPIAISVTLAVLMLGSMIGWSARIAGNPNWETFTDARFAELRNAGKPVLVKFTANWCGTCQVIEGTVFQNSAVWDRIKSEGITPLKLDLTHTSAPGRPLLLSLNPSGGIPLTAIWVGNAEKPVILESIYTSSELFTAIDRAKAEAALQQQMEPTTAPTKSLKLEDLDLPIRINF